MSVQTAAKSLARRLEDEQLRVVFAESCTAGLVSASLAGVAGISQWHCGSAVTYRNETKMAWLGVSKRSIQRFTEVSETVAQQMATGVLKNTPEADVAASVTGHLGPNAPVEQDGIVYIGVARKTKSKIEIVYAQEHRLKKTTRKARQREAAELVLQTLGKLLR